MHQRNAMTAQLALEKNPSWTTRRMKNLLGAMHSWAASAATIDNAARSGSGRNYASMMIPAKTFGFGDARSVWILVGTGGEDQDEDEQGEGRDQDSRRKYTHACTHAWQFEVIRTPRISSIQQRSQKLFADSRMALRQQYVICRTLNGTAENIGVPFCISTMYFMAVCVGLIIIMRPASKWEPSNKLVVS